MDRWFLCSVLVGSIVGAIPGEVQAQYPCRRVDTPSGRGCGAFIYSLEVHAGYESDYASDDDLGETAASVSELAEASSAEAAASASGDAWSECPIDQGNTSYMPEVTSEAEGGIAASILQSGGYATTYASLCSAVNTRFEVESGAGSNPVLYGNIYLLVSGDESGNSLMTWGMAQGICGGSNVTATSMGLDISIAATLQTENGTEQFWDWYVGDLNALYTTEEATSDGNVHVLSSSTSYDGWGTANSSSPSVESDWYFYAESWFEVEEE